ncbi:MAG: MerR family transcriptional regulator, partial [Longicatena sp.]
MKEIMNKYNISKRTLYYYEEESLLQVCRNEKNHRIFNETDCAMLQSILFLRSAGLTIAEIKQQLDSKNEKLFIGDTLKRKKAEIKQDVKMLSKQMKELEDIRARYVDKKIENVLDCDVLNKVKPKHRGSWVQFSKGISISEIIILIFSTMCFLLGIVVITFIFYVV